MILDWKKKFRSENCNCFQIAFCHVVSLTAAHVPTFFHYFENFTIIENCSIITSENREFFENVKIWKRTGLHLQWRLDHWGQGALAPLLIWSSRKKGNTPPWPLFMAPSWAKEGTLDFFLTGPPSLANLQAPLYICNPLNFHACLYDIRCILYECFPRENLATNRIFD